MEFNKQDLVQCDNLIKALKKGTFTLEGLEVMALAQAMGWIGKLHAVILAAVEPKPEETTAEIKEVKDPITPNAPIAKPPRKKT